MRWEKQKVQQPQPQFAKGKTNPLLLEVPLIKKQPTKKFKNQTIGKKLCQKLR